ncbi:hypothetical protein ElyMa_003841000 [Elysia marginata]|uniref:Adenomatous polyposis coli protein n=1 Tax=Elysia marginata TaxID=1093978 RepID=A0AAV4FHU6_9GAST|nr:hypothetical protein ElyMa_003841000 [Elysia marginata]
MLKWTSKSSFRNANGRCHGSTDNIEMDRSEKEWFIAETDSQDTEVRKLTNVREEIPSLGSLPFSYTNPVASHKLEYPYLKRLDMKNTSIDKTELMERKSTDSIQKSQTEKLNRQEFSRSKSLPRLGSPVSSGSSFGGSKKGILAKMRKVFRRSKGEENGERRSVSQPASPKTVMTKTKAETKPCARVSKIHEISNSERSSTKTKRRIELWKGHRKKVDVAKAEPSVTDRSLTEIGGAFNDLLIEYKDDECNLSLDRSSNGDYYEGHSNRQLQRLEPTFETFRATTTPLYSDTDIEEGLKDTSGLESFSPCCQNETDKSDQHIIVFKNQTPNTARPRLCQPTDHVTPPSNISTVLSASAYNPPYLPQQSVSDQQMAFREKTFVRPRTSYSRISHLTSFYTDTTTYNQAMTATGVNKPLYDWDNISFPVPLAEDPPQMLQSPFGIDNKCISLEPDFEAKYNVVKTQDLQTWNKLWEGKDIGPPTKAEAEIRTANFQTTWEFQIPKNTRSESFSSDNMNWSEECVFYTPYNERDQGVQRDDNVTNIYLLPKGSNSCNVQNINISEGVVNGWNFSRTTEDETSLEQDRKNGMENYVSKGNLDRYPAKTNDTDCTPTISPALSSANTKSPSMSFEGIANLSHSPTSTFQPQQIHANPIITSAKNNNNGHGAFREKTFRFEAGEDGHADTLIAEEGKNVKKADWSGTRGNVYTDYIVGVAQQENDQSRVQENDMTGIGCSPAQKVKSIVHHLEEQIKLKGDGHVRLWANTSNFQGLDCKEPARASVSFSAVNEQELQHKHTIGIERVDDNQNIQDGLGRENHDSLECHALKANFSNCDVKIRDSVFIGDESLQSANTDVANNSSEVSSRSPSSDTHSLCSDIGGGLSSDQASNINNSEDSDSEPVQEQREERDGGVPVDPAEQVKQSDEVPTAPHSGERKQDKNLDESQMSPLSASYASLTSPIASPVTLDSLDEQGIMDVTPPCELFEASSSSADFEPCLEHVEGADDGHKLDITQLKQYFGKQSGNWKQFGFQENDAGKDIRILKKPGSILSPAYKPPSPVKKTVSFKLDKTPTPSTSQSTFSDDVAICEAMPPKQKQKIAEVTQEKILRQQPNEDRSVDQAASTDESLTEATAMLKADGSPSKLTETSLGSPDDVSWWKADYRETAEMFEEQTRENISCSLELQDNKDANVCDTSEFTPNKDRQEASGNIVLSTIPSCALENNGTISLPCIERFEELIKLRSPQRVVNQMGMQSSKKLSLNMEPDEAGKLEQVGIQREEVITENQGKHEIDNASYKSDVCLELSESRSDLQTYSVIKEPLKKPNAMPFKDVHDDNIDGLLVDIDVSSALSDLVDQVESLGSKGTPMQSPTCDETSPVSKNNVKGKTLNVVHNNVPFWEKKKSLVPSISVAKRKALPFSNMKNRVPAAKENARSAVSKGAQMVSGNENISEQQKLKPKGRLLKYRWSKFSVRKQKETPFETNHKKGFCEKTPLLGTMINNKMKEKGDQMYSSNGTTSLKQRSPIIQKPQSSFQSDLEILENNVEKDTFPFHAQSIVSSRRTRRQTKLPRRVEVVSPRPASSKTKSTEEPKGENFSTTSSLPTHTQNKPKENGSSCQAQCHEKESKTFEIPEPLHADGLQRFCCSSPAYKESNSLREEKTRLPEPEPLLSCQSHEHSNLGPTSSRDIDFNEGFSSDSSIQNDVGDGESPNKSLYPRNRISHDSSEYENESNDSFSGSFDDLTYDIHNSRSIRYRQRQNLDIHNTCSIQYRQRPNLYCNTNSDTDIGYDSQPARFRRPSCSYNHSTISPDRDTDSPRAIPIYEKRVPPENHEAFRSRYVNNNTALLKADTSPTGSAEENRSGEWLFIATFFLLQVLLHWVHASNK